MRHAFILLAFCMALVTAACETKEGPTPASAVYAAKNAYQAALIAAVQYNELPRCGQPTSPPLCSEQAAVIVIRKAAHAADEALDAAERTVRDPAIKADAKTAAVTAAENAVEALANILALYGQKG